MVVLPGCDAGAVQGRVDTLTAAASDVASRDLASSPELLTIAVGHACFPDDGEDPESLMAKADHRLHAVKQQSVTQGLANLTHATTAPEGVTIAT